MFKKSFAEMLKENLTEDSFKPPTPTPPPPSPPLLLPSTSTKSKETKELFSEDTLHPFLKEVKPFYITVKDISKIYSSRTFHKQMFKEPVKLVFYWAEEDWQGSLFVIYFYKNKYIYISGGFGSCELCDGYPQDEENLMRKFRNLQVSDSIENIELSSYSHPDLIKHLDKFKLKSSKFKRKNYDKETRCSPTINQNSSIKSWASLFK